MIRSRTSLVDIDDDVPMWARIISAALCLSLLVAAVSGIVYTIAIVYGWLA